MKVKIIIASCLILCGLAINYIIPSEATYILKVIWIIISFSILLQATKSFRILYLYEEVCGTIESVVDRRGFEAGCITLIVKLNTKNGIETKEVEVGNKNFLVGSNLIFLIGKSRYVKKEIVQSFCFDLLTGTIGMVLFLI